MIAAAPIDRVLSRFKPVEGESDRQKALREGTGGLALHWLRAVQDGSPDELKRMDAAIDMLADAMAEACAACKA